MTSENEFYIDKYLITVNGAELFIVKSVTYDSGQRPFEKLIVEQLKLMWEFSEFRISSQSYVNKTKKTNWNARFVKNIKAAFFVAITNGSKNRLCSFVNHCREPGRLTQDLRLQSFNCDTFLFNNLKDFHNVGKIVSQECNMKKIHILSLPLNIKEISLKKTKIISFQWDRSCNYNTLTKLDLSNNFIQEFSFKYAPIGLKELNLSNNKITEIDFLHCPRKLSHLFLRKNPIKTDGLINISKLPSHIVIRVPNKVVSRNRPNRDKAARVIQAGLHNWLNSGKCEDGTIGIRLRIDVRELFHVELGREYNVTN